MAQRLTQALGARLRIERQQREREIGPDQDPMQGVAVLVEQDAIELRPGERIREQPGFVRRTDGERDPAGGHVVDGDGDRQAVHVEAHPGGE